LFFLMIYAANVLGVETFGYLSYAIAILSFLVVISDFGLSLSLVKSIAQEPQRRDVLVWWTTCTKGIMTLFTFGLLFALFFLFKPPVLVRTYLLLAVLGLGAGLYAQVMSAVFRGTDRIHLDGIAKLISGFIAVIFGFVVLKLGFGILGLGLVSLVSAVVYSMMSYGIGRRHNIQIRVAPLFSAYKEGAVMIQRALPFGILAFLVAIYFRIDVVLLEHLKGSREAGLYNAAFRFLEAALILPSVFSVVLLPLFSEMFSRSEMEKVRTLTQNSVKFFISLGLPLAVMTTLLADEVIRIFYHHPEYQDAVTVLQVLIWAVVAIYISGTTSTLIMASRAPSVNTWIALIMVITNIGLNMALIPKWGVQGAAAATVVTEFGGVGLNTVWIRRYIMPIEYFRHTYRPIIASLGMGAVIYWAHSLYWIPIYVAVYIGMMYILGGFSKAEIAAIQKMVPKLNLR
jgi:O-antigen/teichoic acid export membrane protein